MVALTPASSFVMKFDCSRAFSASFLISSATTEKPFPEAPAWAASIAAFMARRSVRLEMSWITWFASRSSPTAPL